MNYEDMDYITLRKHQLLIEGLIVTKRSEAAAKFKQALDEAGFTAEDLNAVPAPAGKVRKPAKPKYQNPANPDEVWSGRGKPPKWMQAHLEGGGEKDAYLINT